MDGTVIYTRRAAVQAAKNGLRTLFDRLEREPSIPAEEEIVQHIGLPSNEYFQALLPDDLSDQALLLKEIVQKREVRRIQNGEVSFYGNMEHVLSRLKKEGIPLALVTNAGRSYFEANRDQLSLDSYFQSLYCVSDSSSGEKSELIERVLKEFQHPETAFLVGDRKFDQQAAQECDVPFIGCEWGYGTASELSGADRMVREPEDLISVLLEDR